MAKFEFPKEMFKVPGFMKTIATNKYVLYIVAFFALTNILGYVMMNKNICVLLFILIAYAMTYFTKNMVFVLLVPMFVVGFFSICKETTEIIERFTNKEGAPMQEGDSVVSISGDMSGVIETMKDGEVTIRISPAEGDEQGEEETLTMEESEFKKHWKSAKEGMEGNDPEEEFLEEEEKVLAEEGTLLNEEEEEDIEDEEIDLEGFGVEVDSKKKSKKKKKTESNKMNKDKLKGMSLPSTTGGINKKKTLKSAMTTMEDGLGEQGMAGLAGDTQRLMKNQEALMDAMKNMGPMLQQAKGMLDSLDIGGLGGAISAITGGKGGAKENFGVMSKMDPLGYSAYP